MGQFRPSQRLRDGARPAPDLALFSAAFATSSVIAFLALDTVIGEALRGLPVSWRYVAALLGTFFLAGLEWRRLRRGQACSLGLGRQTPRHLGRVPIGVVAWGLDTGIPVTTVRATILPFVGVYLTALGLAGKWVGLAYAIGFLLPLWVLCIVPRPASATAVLDLDWISDVLLRAARHARVAAVVMSCAGGLMLGGLVLWT